MSNAGWWPDPMGRNEMRYHDGAQWTEHVSNRGAVSVDPLAPTPPPVPQPASPFAAPTQPMPTQQMPTQPMPVQPQPQPSPFAPPGQQGTSPFGTAPMPSGAVPFGSGADAPPPLIQPAGTPKRLTWVLLLVAVVVIAVVAAVVVAVVGGGGDDEAVSGSDSVSDTTVSITEVPPGTTAIAPPETNAPDTVVPTTSGEPSDLTVPPDTTGVLVVDTTAPPSNGNGDIPDGSAGAVPVGTTVRAEGSLVRVNSVTEDAPYDDFFAPEAGNTVTAIEIEACAGPDGFYSSTFNWTAFLVDNSPAGNYIFSDDYQSLQLAEGGCTRGVITYEVPEGNPVASIVLTGSSFDEIARWNVTGGSAAPDARIAPEAPPEAIAIGDTATFGAGHTATVKTVQDAAPPLDDIFPPDDGRQYTRVDVEMCAGDEPLNVNALFWFASTTDNWMGTSALVGDTLPVIEVAAGECVSGQIEISVPAGSTTNYIVYADNLTQEAARWKVE